LNIEIADLPLALTIFYLIVIVGNVMLFQYSIYICICR